MNLRFNKRNNREWRSSIDDKNTLLLIILAISFVASSLFLYNNQVRIKLEFDETKAALMKENLEMKKRLQVIKVALDSKEDILASLAREQKRIEAAASFGKAVSESLEPARGEVLSVDEKLSLVTFDVGRMGGAKSGKKCLILKDEKEIASAEIVKARYRASAAFINKVMHGYNICDIKAGDNILIVD